MQIEHRARGAQGGELASRSSLLPHLLRLPAPVTQCAAHAQRAHANSSCCHPIEPMSRYTLYMHTHRKHQNSRATSRASGQRVARQHIIDHRHRTCSLLQSPTAPPSLSVRVPTATAPTPPGPGSRGSLARPPAATMRSSPALGSLSVCLQGRGVQRHMDTCKRIHAERHAQPQQCAACRAHEAHCSAPACEVVKGNNLIKTEH
jgi:hypothetical protein